MKLLEQTHQVTIYQIEGQFPKSDDKHYSGRWCTRSMSPMHFGERHAKTLGDHSETWDKACPIYKEYCACGQCWQTTGQEGFLDQELARKAFGRITVFAPGDEHTVRWRLVMRIVSVKVHVLAETQAIDPKRMKANGV